MKKDERARQLEKILHEDPLDAVEHAAGGDFHVHFYATSADRDTGDSLRATVSLLVSSDNTTKVASSKTLPTNLWFLDAAAYTRALKFALRLQTLD